MVERIMPIDGSGYGYGYGSGSGDGYGVEAFNNNDTERVAKEKAEAKLTTRPYTTIVRLRAELADLQVKYACVDKTYINILEKKEAELAEARKDMKLFAAQAYNADTERDRLRERAEKYDRTREDLRTLKELLDFRTAERDRLLGIFGGFEMPCESIEQATMMWNKAMDTKQERDRLRETLGWYAEKHDLQSHPVPDVGQDALNKLIDDCGKRAREALAGSESEMESCVPHGSAFCCSYSEAMLTDWMPNRGEMHKICGHCLREITRMPEPVGGDSDQEPCNPPSNDADDCHNCYWMAELSSNCRCMTSDYFQTNRKHGGKCHYWKNGSFTE